MESPLDFFDINFRLYPLAVTAKVIDVTLNAGDCLYIPAYYFVQSQTNKLDDGINESIFVSKLYSPHSKFMGLIFDGLESDSMMHAGDSLHENDALLYNALKNYF